MTHAGEPGGALVVLGRGEADRPQPDLFEPRVRATVRYADPAAWITAAAVARVLSPVKNQLAALQDKVSMIVTSDEGPGETMAVVAEAAGAGYSSPLRYPAALPGSLVGVTCIAFGFRGPTLNFTLPPARGVPTSLLVAEGWLRRRVVPCVALASCGRAATGGLYARCLLLAAEDFAPAPGAPLAKGDIAWVSLVPETDLAGDT